MAEQSDAFSTNEEVLPASLVDLVCRADLALKESKASLVILANEDTLACPDRLATMETLVQEARRAIAVKLGTDFLATLVFLVLLANAVLLDSEETGKEELVAYLDRGDLLDRRECKALLDHKEFVILLIARCGIRRM